MTSSLTITWCPWSAKIVQLPINANSLSPKIFVIKPKEIKKKTLYSLGLRSNYHDYFCFVSFSWANVLLAHFYPACILCPGILVIYGKSTLDTEPAGIFNLLRLLNYFMSYSRIEDGCVRGSWEIFFCLVLIAFRKIWTNASSKDRQKSVTKRSSLPLVSISIEYSIFAVSSSLWNQHIGFLTSNHFPALDIVVLLNTDRSI